MYLYTKNEFWNLSETIVNLLKIILLFYGELINDATYLRYSYQKSRSIRIFVFKTTWFF